MNQARIAGAGLQTAAQNLATAWYHDHSVNTTVIGDFQTMYGRLMDVYHNTSLAKSAVDA